MNPKPTPAPSVHAPYAFTDEARDAVYRAIFKPSELQQALGIPKGLTLIAYPCAGYVSHFHPRPELQAAGCPA